jgi:uncharacterized peroxidase-related enzyme
MAHIQLPEGLPGIRELLAFSPETAKPLSELAGVLLYAPDTFSPAERELIATYVASRNDCTYCQTSHGAVVAYHQRGDEDAVLQVTRDFERASVSDKLKSLLAIADKVQQGGKTAPRTWRSTILSSWRRHSACIIAIWMA